MVIILFLGEGNDINNQGSRVAISDMEMDGIGYPSSMILSVKSTQNSLAVISWCSS